MTVRFTRARNLRELNRMAEYPVKYAGYYAYVSQYEGKMRAYRFCDNPYLDAFAICYNSDREQFIMKGKQ